MAIISDSPIGPQTEYRPPTQFSKPNTCSGGMPKLSVLSVAELSAANCAAGSPPPSVIHARAVRAFVIVSIVVKVLEATITSVRRGSRVRSTSETWAPSTFDTKWQRGPS